MSIFDITEKVREILPSRDKFDDETEVSFGSDGCFTIQHKSDGVRYSELRELATYFEVEDFDTDDYRVGGCETCGYGGHSVVTHRIHPSEEWVKRMLR